MVTMLDTNMEDLLSFLINQGFPVNRIKAYSNQEEYVEALRKGSKNGGVSAILDEIPYLTYFLSNPRYKKGFAFPLSSPLVHNLFIAILSLTGEYEGPQIEERWLGPAAPSVGDSPINGFTALTLRSFSGLFIITGCVSALMLLITIVRLACTKYKRSKGSELQNANGYRGSVCLGESIELQNHRGDDSVPNQHLHEIRDNNYQDSEEGNVNGAGIEAGPMQNGMYDGPVPADCVQIEMGSTGQGVGMSI